MAAEEATTAAEEGVATVPEKEKEIAEDASEKEDFNFQNLIGQELSKAEKEELRDYAISCGYEPGALLFGRPPFLKSGCTHGKIVNRPNFSLSPADLIDIPSLARSIGNRFIKLLWTKGGRSLAGDEARSHMKPVTKSYLVLTFSFRLEFSLQHLNMYRMTKLKSRKPKHSRRSEAQ
jgi:hypothetical protein